MPHVILENFTIGSRVFTDETFKYQNFIWIQGLRGSFSEAIL